MKRLDNTQRIKRTVALAMFAALAYAVHFVHIPVGFLNLDFKDVVITVCGMYFGPLSGIIVAIVVPLLEFITVSSTGVYGLLMNVLGSVTFVGTASLIYKFKKTLTGAVVGLVSAAFAMTAVMIGANLLITPYYMGVGLSDVATLIPTLLLPFNSVKAILNASLTLCLYKPITSVLKRNGFKNKTVENTGNSNQQILKNTTNMRVRTALVWIISGSIAVASLCVIFFVLGGRFAFFS
ncbi:MAG: ECF transporter S component [Clostridia bacterium]|nr:ECF transporter S component [Clostridia bacterium]